MPRRPSLPLLLILAASFFGVACGGPPPEERALAALAKGQLERAEALLGQAGGPEAERVREQCAALRQERGVLEQRLASLLQRVEGGEREALDELDELRQQVTDPWSVEAVSVARSQAADLAAELRGRRPAPRPPKAQAQGPGSEPLLAPAPADGLTELFLEDVRAAMNDGQWVRAQELLDEVREAAGRPLGALEALAGELQRRLQRDVELVLDRARREQALRGQREALGLLHRERWRFAQAGSGAAVHERFLSLAEALEVDLERDPAFRSATPGRGLGAGTLAALEHVEADPGRAARPQEPAAGSTVVSAVEAPSPARQDPPRVPAERWQRSVAELALEGGRLARDGRLADAAERFRQAALQTKGAEQGRFSARARDAESRSRLRLALAEAAAQGHLPGAEQADEQGLTLAGRGYDWRDLAAEELLALAQRAGREDILGLTLELLALTDGSGAERGGERLQAAEQAGLVSPAERNELLALHRGETAVPSGGYLWVEGAWRTASEVDASLLGSRLEGLSRDLSHGDPGARDLAFAELQSLAGSNRAAAEALSTGVQERLFQAGRTLQRGRTLKRLESLAGRRALLDSRRQELLALVEDEQRYFYPYLAPQVSAEREAEYRLVQQAVERLAAQLEELWDSDPGVVELDAGFRQALRDLSWCLETLESWGRPAPYPEGLPSWIEGLDPELEGVDVRSFAWSRQEARQLALGRRIRARNQELLESTRLDVRPGERLLLRMTNDYRERLGRLPLGWHPALQDAAGLHASYMAQTGHFGHHQDGPLRLPQDRMRHAGYSDPGAENCHVGSQGASGALESWLASSPHHRNLLDPAATELAVDQEGTYWVQVFGTATAWRESL